MLRRVQTFGLTIAMLLILALLSDMLTPAVPPEPLNTLKTAKATQDLIDWPNPLPSKSADDATAFFNDLSPLSDSAVQSTAADAENVEFVGHVGGVTDAVFLAGGYAYIGVGPRLTILDISNPAFPIAVSRTAPFPGIVSDVYIFGGYAYVTASGVGLRVVDISNPVSPSEVGFYNTPGGAVGVAVAPSGDYAYVADYYEGLRVVDISDPVSPCEVGFYNTPGRAWKVTVAPSGDYAYVADGGSGLRVVDISSPDSPSEVGYYDMWRAARDVALAPSGNYAYVTDFWEGLRVVDISSPNNPSEVGYYDTPGYAVGVAVATSGDCAYVADLHEGLRVVDISSSTSPSEMGYCDTPGLAYSVAVAGDYAYVADDLGGGLRVVDISSPTSPREVGFYDMLGWAVSVAVAGDYAYVADAGSGLRVVDISSPASPNEVGYCDTPGDAVGMAVAPSGDYAYVADYHEGLRVVDISDPVSPCEVGFYNTPGYARDVIVMPVDDYVYVADDESGLRVVDISRLASPSEVGHYDTPGSAWGVADALSGDYVYVADYESGLRVVDVSIPASPSEVGYCDTPGYAYDVAVAPAGDYAYVADYESGLRVVDVSIPASPSEVGYCDTPGYAWGVAVTPAGDYAYVADGASGLRVVDISIPASPSEVGFYTPGYALDVAVMSTGDYVCVADRGGGLVILRYTGGGPTYSISGQVRDDNGSPISGVTVSAGVGGSAITDASGAYTIDDLTEGTFTLTPSKSGWTFTPDSRTVSVPPSTTGQDFTGSAEPTGPPPSGSVTLLSPPGVPLSHPLAVTAQVRNTGIAYQEFTLTVRLWQDDTVLDTQPFTFSLSRDAAARQIADFGLRPVGRYRVEAVLSANGALLATQSRQVIVVNTDTTRIILDYADDLKAAAHAELDDISYIPSQAVCDEILSFGLDKLEDYVIGKFADLAAPIQEAGGIPSSTSDDAITQVQDKLGRARQYRRNLAAAIRLYVHDMYDVTLPDGFDPLNPDLDFITDPLLKDLIKNWMVGYLADLFSDKIIGPLWVNGPRGDVDGRHLAFEDFLLLQDVIEEPSGLAVQMQHGRDRIGNVVEGDAIVTLGPYKVLGHTLRYDLTLQEQEHKRQQVHVWGDVLKALIAILASIGVVIILLLFAGAISSAGALAAVAGKVIWKIVEVLLTIKNLLPFVLALIVVSMLFTVFFIAPHVSQYHDETLDAAETLISGSGMARLRSFDVDVQTDQAQLTAQIDGPEEGQSQVLVETALYSVDGRIINIVWSPLQVQAGQGATLSKDVPLAPGGYHAVTTLYAEGDIAAAERVPFKVPGPRVELDLQLSRSRLNPGDSVEATVNLTNTSNISDVSDLTLVVESTDGVNVDAWPVSLTAGGTQQIDYTFTPTTTGPYVLRAWLGIGVSALAQQDVAYVVGSGPAVALNTRVSDVYTPGLTVTLPLTLANVGDVADSVTVAVQTVDRLQTGVVVSSSTLTTIVPASGTVLAEAIALPNAQPGLYAVWLAVNGTAYDSRDFAVSAEDTLFGLLTVGELYSEVEHSVAVTATVHSADSTPTDAVITATVRSPTGAFTTLPMAWVSNGTYRADYRPSISGTYSLELTVARAGYRTVGDRAFLVAEAPTLLIPTVKGQPQAGEIRPITITVQSGAGAPIPGATVILSGTEEILRGEMDAAGRVCLQTFPPDGHPYVMTTEKMGYAGATTEVAVQGFYVYLPLILHDR